MAPISREDNKQKILLQEAWRFMKFSVNSRFIIASNIFCVKLGSRIPKKSCNN